MKASNIKNIEKTSFFFLYERKFIIINSQRIPSVNIVTWAISKYSFAFIDKVCKGQD